MKRFLVSRFALFLYVVVGLVLMFTLGTTRTVQAVQQPLPTVVEGTVIAVNGCAKDRCEIVVKLSEDDFGEGYIFNAHPEIGQTVSKIEGTEPQIWALVYP